MKTGTRFSKKFSNQSAKAKGEIFKKITFEDHGQDFLVFTCSQDGKVIDVQPFQFDIWSKYKVTNLNEMYEGGFVKLMKVEGEERFSCMTIKYPIKSIE